PFQRIQVEAPANFKEICSSFVKNFRNEPVEFALQKYFHDNT
ncbi:26453_t:CDS:1, partial [Racocetra persica]